MEAKDVRILAIDDDVLVRSSLEVLLRQQGYSVTTASNGYFGLECLKNGEFDIVITDLFMPDVEGLETIIEIRRRVPPMKILAISGGGRSMNKDFLASAKLLGANETLPKPFDEESLLAAVRRLHPDDLPALEIKGG